MIKVKGKFILIASIFLSLIFHGSCIFLLDRYLKKESCERYTFIVDAEKNFNSQMLFKKEKPLSLFVETVDHLKDGDKGAFLPRPQTVDTCPLKPHVKTKDKEFPSLHHISYREKPPLKFNLATIEKKGVRSPLGTVDVESSFQFIRKIQEKVNNFQFASLPLDERKEVLVAKKEDEGQCCKHSRKISAWLPEVKYSILPPLFEEDFKHHYLALKRISSIDKDERGYRKTPPSLLLTLPHLEKLKVISCGEDFNLDVTYVPRDDEAGYVFAITLFPKSEQNFKKIKQNFFFLIDHSNSIQVERLTSTRHAVISSLSLLDKKDTFNVLTFDHTINLLAERNLPVTSSSISWTNNFLLKQKLGSFFSSTNLFAPFQKLMAGGEKKEEITTAIFLSNGEGFHKSKNYGMMKNWSYKNGGKISLFTLSLSTDTTLPTLDFFSVLNKGKLVTSSTKRGIKRTLMKLIRDISYPIAKNVAVNPITLDDTNISIYPPFPNIYLHQPYVILGTIDRLNDFVLFIQGKNGRSTYNIRKNITFYDAAKGGESLKRKWALHRAYRYYEGYLIYGHPDYLKEAKKVIQPHGIGVAFQ